MKGTLHLVTNDLGCLSRFCNCEADAWKDPKHRQLHREISDHLRLCAEFQQYLHEQGDVE